MQASVAVERSTGRSPLLAPKFDSTPQMAAMIEPSTP